MKALYSGVSTFVLFSIIGISLPAQAAQLSANVTADNHYGLYYGQVDGSGLSFVGTNEGGDDHIPDTDSPIPAEPCNGVFNWQCPETWTFSVNPGDYLYVIAWDDAGPQSWIGDFQLPDGSLLLSNTTDWEYAIASGSTPFTGTIPPLLDLATEIANATWNTPQASAPQGSAPWGTIPNISLSSQFIWHDTLSDDSLSDGNYVIFRSKSSVFSTPESVPEPTTTLGLGLFGITWLFNRKRKA